MPNVLDILAAAAGLAFVAEVLWDVFQTVVVPRPTRSRLRIARTLTRQSWRLWRWRAFRATSNDARERLLGTFAPAGVLALLGVWVVFLIVGLGLVLWSVRGQLAPVPADPLDAMYAAGVSLLTIGFGDVVPTGPLARIVALAAAGTGLGVVALTVTYLFSLYAAFQRRERLVTTLDARAGAPPSGIVLLETYARLGMVDQLDALFGEWETWAAEVLDSHLAYPILCYFRSSHDNESWLSSLGAVLDAATLFLTTVEDVPHGRAKMLHSVGNHLVEDVSRFFGFPDDDGPGVERDEYDDARTRLAAAGYRLAEEEPSWEGFVRIRSLYANRLNRMADYWVSPPAQWIGDRAPMVYRRRRH